MKPNCICWSFNKIFTYVVHVSGAVDVKICQLLLCTQKVCVLKPWIVIFRFIYNKEFQIFDERK